MAIYRLFQISQTNHINAPGVDHDFESDAQALEMAETLADGRAIDVWQAHRFVGLVAARPRVMMQAEG